MTVAKPATGTAVLSDKTAAYNSATTVLSECTSTDTTNAIQVAAEVIATYLGANAGGRLEVFGSLDDTNWSTEPFAAYDMAFTASTSTRQVFGVANAPRYIRFRVKNLSTSNFSITGITINVAMQTVS